MTGKHVDIPPFVTEEHLIFLDELRDSGDTNMYGDGSYLESKFPELSDEHEHPSFRSGLGKGYRSSPKTREILAYWMESFTERHSNER